MRFHPSLSKGDQLPATSLSGVPPSASTRTDQAAPPNLVIGFAISSPSSPILQNNARRPSSRLKPGPNRNTRWARDSRAREDLSQEREWARARPSAWSRPLRSIHLLE